MWLFKNFIFLLVKISQLVFITYILVAGYTCLFCCPLCFGFSRDSSSLTFIFSLFLWKQSPSSLSFCSAEPANFTKLLSYKTLLSLTLLKFTLCEVFMHPFQIRMAKAIKLIQRRFQLYVAQRSSIPPSLSRKHLTYCVLGSQMSFMTASHWWATFIHDQIKPPGPSLSLFSFQLMSFQSIAHMGCEIFIAVGTCSRTSCFEMSSHFKVIQAFLSDSLTLLCRVMFPTSSDAVSIKLLFIPVHHWLKH